MSAWFNPACGQAPATLSIFTANAGRVAAAAVDEGRPVSGSIPDEFEADGEELSDPAVLGDDAAVDDAGPDDAGPAGSTLE
jgi:hypothetical protein